ncbi:MAG: hypothetical protein A4E65_02145 [Syntrophorhabdus sp. PtaU1.Bin153]|nr:MAG: hypothetical protein A4E65_02145 [Syntrophorhabdus sp. PtaU1.Bin153]
MSRATSSEASRTAAAPSADIEVSSILIGVEIGLDFITSSTVIWFLKAATALAAAFFRLRTAARAKSSSVAPYSYMYLLADMAYDQITP